MVCGHVGNLGDVVFVQKKCLEFFCLAFLVVFCEGTNVGFTTSSFLDWIRYDYICFM